MKRLVIAGFLLAASAPMLAFADNGYALDERDDYQPSQPLQIQQTYQDSARVTRVTPHFELVSSPEEKCRMEVERVAPMNNGGANNQGRNFGGTVLGGIAGALLGSQVGGGTGRTAATAVGAIGGALIGDRVANGMDSNQFQGASERQVRRCNTFNQTEERAAGYDVSYQYQGKNYTALMQHNPGRNVRVNVTVAPID